VEAHAREKQYREADGLFGLRCAEEVHSMEITCLLVEQNDDLIYLVQRYGQEVGIRIVTATGVEAVARAGEEQPAVILLGSDLPGQKGWEVLHALKDDGRTCHIPVVMYAGMDQRARMLEEGADSCLQLPWGRDDLLAALEMVGVWDDAADLTARKS
jgi:CheY-like chemotaxis protein